MTNRSELGKLGEDLACIYLIKNGYSIIERNFRMQFGELDVISRSPDGTLVFVEVKAMTDVGRQTPFIPADRITPEDQLTRSKIKKLKKTASLYSGHRQYLVRDSVGWRIDAITILIPPYSSPHNLTKLLKTCVVNYYENI